MQRGNAACVLGTVAPSRYQRDQYDMSINRGRDRIGHDHWHKTYGTSSTECGRQSFMAYLLLADWSMYKSSVRLLVAPDNNVQHRLLTLASDVNFWRMLKVTVCVWYVQPSIDLCLGWSRYRGSCIRISLVIFYIYYTCCYFRSQASCVISIVERSLCGTVLGVNIWHPVTGTSSRYT